MFKQPASAVVILSAAIGLSLTPIALPACVAANAAEIKVLCANGAKSMVVDLIAEFERTTGNKVTIGYGGAKDLRIRVQYGESFDVVVLPAMEQILPSGEVARDSVAEIARSDLGMGMRDDAAKADTSTADGLKHLLLSVKSVAYTDPVTGGRSGVLFADMLEKLGIAEQINNKSKLMFGVHNSQLVAKGDADLAVQFSHEILAVPGIQFFAMPPEFQSSIVFSAALSARTKQPDAAKALIKLLSSPAAAPVYLTSGMPAG